MVSGGISLPLPANDPEFGIFEAGLVAIDSLRIVLSIARLVIA
jgi:hypothetical protein